MTSWRSLPARGAWVEMSTTKQSRMTQTSRSPHGERGLKWRVQVNVGQWLGRSPHGERGLKLGRCAGSARHGKSLPARGAWVEILERKTRCGAASCRSPHGERGLKSAHSGRDGHRSEGRSPHGERGLKLIRAGGTPCALPSLPARGAWVEIRRPCNPTPAWRVAPRTGSVG